MDQSAGALTEEDLKMFALSGAGVTKQHKTARSGANFAFFAELHRVSSGYELKSLTGGFSKRPTSQFIIEVCVS